MDFEFERTNDPYVMTSELLVKEKLKELNLKPGESLIDLGSGDGQCMITAAKLYQVNCTGYEILPEALSVSSKNIEDSGVGDLVEVIDRDFLEADLSKADAVIIYLTRTALGQLSLKLENELRKGARIVTHQFDLPAWEEKLVKEVVLPNGSLEYIYVYEK